MVKGKRYKSVIGMVAGMHLNAPFVKALRQTIKDKECGKKTVAVELSIKVTIHGDDPIGIGHASVKLNDVLKNAALNLNYEAPTYIIKVNSTKLTCTGGSL
jgi:hypothetical protein